MNLLEQSKNLLFIFPVMLYYALESLIAAVVVNFVWVIALRPLFNISINYLQWVAIIWIIKVVFFDVFKLISGLTNMNNQVQSKIIQEPQEK
jgi:hypothetical protein